MQKKVLDYLTLSIGIALGALFAIDLLFLPLPAEAGCRPTGRVVAGRPVLRCSGRTRCRATGRFKVVNGVRYSILSCPRR